MTRAEIPTIKIFNRPFKPLAVGLILATGTLGVNFLFYLLASSFLVLTPVSISPVLSTLAIISTVLMIYSWIVKSQRIYEVALVFAVGAWAFSSIGLLLDGGGLTFMFPVAMMTMASGAFLLERADERDGMA